MRCSISARICSATASAASRLDASAAVTELITPVSSRMPKAAASTSASEATKVTANEAAIHDATRVRDLNMMLTRPSVVIEQPSTMMVHRIGRNTRYGSSTAPTSIGRQHHCMARMATR